MAGLVARGCDVPLVRLPSLGSVGCDVPNGGAPVWLFQSKNSLVVPHKMSVCSRSDMNRGGGNGGGGM